MIIRKIEEKDAEKYLNMLKQLDKETKYMLYEPDERKTTVDEWTNRIKGINDDLTIILVAEDNKKIVGFLASWRGAQNRNKHSAYVVIGILNEYVGKGIGTQMFTELDKWAKRNNISRLELTVMTHNERGVNLYKKMGFKIEGLKEKGILLDGIFIDEYYMAKII